MLKTPRKMATDRGRSGQALVEFALVLPMLMLLFMALFDVALLFNAFIGVNRASQTAAHMGAIAGNEPCADHLILDGIEKDLTAPNDSSRILEVVIGRTTLNGSRYLQQQTWNRTASSQCTWNGTTYTVPYTRVVSGYMEDQRCQVVGGCTSLTPPRNTVDNIGVTVKYHHRWVTPLNALFDFFGGGDFGWTIEQMNVFRMEPTL